MSSPSQINSQLALKLKWFEPFFVEHRQGLTVHRLTAARKTALEDALAPHLSRTVTESPDVRVYGKLYKQPRQVQFFSDDVPSYRYSGADHPSSPLTPALREVLDAVNACLNSKFNAILVNKYRDGNDKIGAHRDDEKELDGAAGVATLSLGATRTLRLRPVEAKDEKGKSAKSIKNIANRAAKWKSEVRGLVEKAEEQKRKKKKRNYEDYKMSSGDLYVLNAQLNKTYTHEIPACKDKGERISLTFRHHVV